MTPENIWIAVQLKKIEKENNSYKNSIDAQVFDGYADRGTMS